MTQSELNRAVARSTGDSISTIKHLGFVLADPDNPNASLADADVDEGLGPNVIDWDELHERRYALARHPAALACF